MESYKCVVVGDGEFFLIIVPFLRKISFSKLIFHTAIPECLNQVLSVCSIERYLKLFFIIYISFCRKNVKIKLANETTKD